MAFATILAVVAGLTLFFYYSVSTVIDGVVLARPGQATVDLLDLDHIEVLRGPQGTLFGKNASAGAVNIITKNPTDAFHAYADASYFEGDEYRLGAGVSGPILGDALLGRLSLLTSEYDGNVTNRYYDDKVNGYRRNGGRLTLLAKPISNLTLTFNADLTDSTDSVPTGVFVASGRVAYPTNVLTPNAALAGALASEGIAVGANNTTISNNENSDARDRNSGVSLQADWAFGDGYNLTSITAYRKWLNAQNQDYDQLSTLTAALPQLVDRGEVNFYQVSQEFRIASPKGRFFDYVAGLYYLHDEDDELYRRDITQLAAGGDVSNFGAAHYGTVADDVAVFGEGDFNLTRSLRLILGYREIYDNLSFYENRLSSSAAALTGIRPSFAATGATNELNESYRTGLQYDINPSTMAYFTYSRGYKGPAFNVFFNLQPTDTMALKPETSNDYELGVKSRLLENRVQANLVVYRTDFDNFQANFQDEVNGALITRLINAGSVRSQGVEGDITAVPVKDLNLYFAFARTDATVVSFDCPVGSPVSCDVNGQPLPFAPKWKLDVQGDYVVPIYGDYALDLQSDYNWQSDTQYSLAETPDTIQRAYGIWNASIGLLQRKDGWSARFLAKNLLDTHYSSYLAYGDLGGVARFVPRDNDRYVGVNLHKDF